MKCFEDPKKALQQELELYQDQPDKAFFLRTDASGGAIGEVLEQEFQGQLRPVCFFQSKINTEARKMGFQGTGNLYHHKCSPKVGRMDWLQPCGCLHRP